MGVLLALLAAASYGTGDFFGGMSAKRASIWSVVPLSGLFGLVTALGAAALIDPAAPPIKDLQLGAIAGAVGAVAIAALYRGLAVARMSVVAPITAVIAAVVPVAFGVFRGERPGPAAFVGIVLALVAVALVSWTSDEDVAGQPEPRRSGLAEAVIAGIGFGLLYVVLSQTSRGMWPLVAARVVSVIAVGGVALASRRFALPAIPAWPSIALCGIFDMGGNILYLVALRHTLIAIAAVLTSLYPASTVVLARIVLAERLVAVQWIGVATAAVAVALIALG